MDQRRGRRGTRPTDVGVAPAAVAAALLVVVVAALAASSQRPPLAGDGAWSTPVQVVLGGGTVGLLVVVLLVLQGVLGQRARPRPGRGDPWGLLAAVALLLLVAAVVQRLGPPPPDGAGGGGGGVPLEGVGPEAVAPPPVTPTAVVAGLVALFLLAVLAARALRGAAPSRAAADVPAPTGAVGPRGVPALPDGPPTAVVLAAYERARTLVAPRVHAPGRESPGRLLARVRDQPLHAPLRTLTTLHLPVRYGRGTATDADAATARAALAELERLLRTGAPGPDPAAVGTDRRPDRRTGGRA